MPSGLRWAFKDREFRWSNGQSTRPLILGILNVTPDSFSDGGRFDTVERALAEARRLIASGADMIDVGGESTRPDAEPVSAHIELERVIPVVEKLAAQISQPISIDTTKADVAHAAIEAGAEVINDISAGRFDPNMLAVAAKHRVGIILMHTRGTPKTMQKGDLSSVDIVAEVTQHLQSRIAASLAAGIERDAICIDPGIGFGKTVGQNLALIGQLKRFRPLERPVMIGASRKSFIGSILEKDVEHRDVGTHSVSACATLLGAQLVRVHDVAGTFDAIRMANAIQGFCGSHS